MGDRAHELTDQEIEKIQRHLMAVYNRAEKTVSTELKKYAESIKAKSDELQNAIDEAETEEEKKKAKEEYKRFYTGKVLTDKNFKKTAANVAETLYKANTEAAAYINERTAHVYAENYNYIGRGLGRDLNGYGFKKINDKDAEDGGRVTKQIVDKKKDTEWNRKNVARSVIAGALLLYGASKIFGRATKETTKKNLNAANRQASDMMTDAENSGRLDSMYRAYDEGFGVKKYWIATLDNKTRDTHVEYDSMDPVDLDYEYAPGLKKPRDSDCSIMEEVCNCRCTIKYKGSQAKSSTRTAREGEVIGSYKKSSSFEGTKTITVEQMTYKEWAKWRSR